MESLTQKDLDRFWGKVNKNISEVFYNNDRCWEWIAGREGDGYGAFHFLGKGHKSHRISWTIHFGEIPVHLGVLHHCDNPPCVNPSHLFLGSHQTNMSDKAKKKRHGNTGPRTYMPQQNHTCKISAEQAADIRRRYAPWGRGGENMRQLAEAFGISPQEVSNIVHHQRWK